MKRQLSDSVALDYDGRITARTWSTTVLRRHIKGWDVLEDKEKLARINDLDPSLADREIESTNIAVDGLLEHIPEALDPTQAASATASHLALGTATDAPLAGNTQLGNEVYRTIVGDADSDGADLLASALLSQIEANGHTITEIGLAGGPDADRDRLLTHALLDTGQEIEKNSTIVVVFDYVLEFRRPA